MYPYKTSDFIINLNLYLVYVFYKGELWCNDNNNFFSHLNLHLSLNDKNVLIVIMLCN